MGNNEKSVMAGFGCISKSFLGETRASGSLAKKISAHCDWDGYLNALIKRAQANWHAAVHRGQKPPSVMTWALRRTKTDAADATASGEVALERAIARLEGEWHNQIPVASGLTDPYADRKRSVDLVWWDPVNSILELIELKTTSNDPVQASIEILEYACVYLACRGLRSELDLGDRAVLEAKSVRAVVLAPRAFYDERAEAVAVMRLHRPRICDALQRIAAGTVDPFVMDFSVQQFADSFNYTTKIPAEADLRAAVDRVSGRKEYL